MHTLLKSGNEKAAQKMDDGQNVGSHAAEKNQNLQEDWLLFMIIRNNSSEVLSFKIRTTGISFLVKIIDWEGQGGSCLPKGLWTELHNKVVL